MTRLTDLLEAKRSLGKQITRAELEGKTTGGGFTGKQYSWTGDGIHAAHRAKAQKRDRMTRDLLELMDDLKTDSLETKMGYTAGNWRTANTSDRQEFVDLLRSHGYIGRGVNILKVKLYLHRGRLVAFRKAKSNELKRVKRTRAKGIYE
jgi:hypothetical protein